MSAPVRVLRREPKVCFVFSGQGAQFARMGCELEMYSTYANSISHAESYLQSLGSTWSLRAELGKEGETSRINEPELSQPFCTALQVALIDLLHEWNVHPSAVVGHSSGEIAAAFAVGAISRESALKIAYFRGLVAKALLLSAKASLGMLAANFPADSAALYLQGLQCKPDLVTIACINSPKDVTFSGDAQALSMLAENLVSGGIACKRLNVELAYHSSFMGSVTDVYELLISTIDPGICGPHSATFVSSLTSQMVEHSELRSPRYWAQNLRKPVKFVDAICKLQSKISTVSLAAETYSTEQMVDHFVEVGPHPVLKRYVINTFKDLGSEPEAGYSALLDRRLPGDESVLHTAGELHCIGVPISLSSVSCIRRGSEDKVLVDLPVYAFNHSQRYWQENRINADYKFRKYPNHELLGSPILEWNSRRPCWRNTFRVDTSKWVADHKIQGDITLPGTGMLCVALQAMSEYMSTEKVVEGYRVKDFFLHKAIRIRADTGSLDWQLHLIPEQQTSQKSASIMWMDFELFIHENDQWTKASNGSIATQLKQDDSRCGWQLGDNNQNRHSARAKRTMLEAGQRCRIHMGTEELYQEFSRQGIQFGPAFQGITDLRLSHNSYEACAEVDLSVWKSVIETPWSHRYVVHPAALDALLQIQFPACCLSGPRPNPIVMPTLIKDMWISSRLFFSPDETLPPPASVYAETQHIGLRAADISILAMDPFHEQVLLEASVQSTFMYNSWHNTAVSTSSHHHPRCYTLQWKANASRLTSTNARPVFQQMLLDDEGLREDRDIKCLVANVCRLLRDQILPDHIRKSDPHLEKYLCFAQAFCTEHSTEHIDHVCSQETNVILNRVQGYGVTGSLFAEVARFIPQVLNGGISALELLFQGSLVKDFYSYAEWNQINFAQVARYVDLLAHEKPNLKILEIGAGTGSLTEPLLDSLADEETSLVRFQQYVFTDISPSFFEAAKERFARYASRVKYISFDVDLDPVNQGIDAGTFDVVVASNVLHAPPSIQRSLRNVHKLLKPRGTLILHEITLPNPSMYAFVFGLLPGWWSSTDENREAGPLPNENAWSEQLLKAGFSIPRLAMPDYQNAQSATVMICEALPEKKLVPPSRVHVVHIVIRPNDAQRELAERLRSQLLATGHYSVSISPVEGLVSLVKGSNSRVIFLPDLQDAFLPSLTDLEFRGLKAMIQAAEILIWPMSTTRRLDDSPAIATSQGFLRTLRMEDNKLKAVTITFEESLESSPVLDTIVQVFEDTLVRRIESLEFEYEQRDGMMGITRCVESPKYNSQVRGRLMLRTSDEGKLCDDRRPLKLSVMSPGLLQSLCFTDELLAPTPIATGDVEIKVVFSGVNFKDLMVALGQVNEDSLGLEAAGVITRSGDHQEFEPGDRVMCICKGSFASFVRCNSSTAVKVPDHVDLQSAAALPIIFCTAYYALIHQARLQAGEFVLIHSAAGGLGQAAIQVAQMVGAKVLATVSSRDKRDFLIAHYQLRPDHVFSHQSSDILRSVRDVTNCHGIDVVLGSLGGDMMKTSWDCVAPFGRYVEVGKGDIQTAGRLPMRKFSDNVSFMAVDLSHLTAAHRPAVVKELLQTTIDLFAAGRIKIPQDFRVYKASRIEEALKTMQNRQTMGKAVIEFDPNDIVQVVSNRNLERRFDPTKSYVIVGGLGELGQRIARWMTKRGARHLILLSRQESESDNADVVSLLEELRACEVDVACPACDIGDFDALNLALLGCMQKMPPVKGCVQASVVLRDNMIENISFKNFQEVLKPKVQGPWNLHRALPGDLDFFILLSSTAGIVGNIGQSAYAAGNVYQDALARHRVTNGQKAVSIDLGLVNDATQLLKRLSSQSPNSMIKSQIGLSGPQLLAILDVFCDPSLPILGAEDAQVVFGLDTAENLRERGVERAYWLDSLLLRFLQHDTHGGPEAVTLDRANTTSSVARARDVECSTKLRQSTSLPEATGHVCQTLVGKLSRSMDVGVDEIDISQPLYRYGIDSLSAVELRQWFSQVAGADVTVWEMLEKKIWNLSEEVAQRSSFVPLNAKCC